MEGKKVFGTILGVVALIVIVTSLTYAWYTWQSASDEATGVTFTVQGLTDCITSEEAATTTTGSSTLIPVSNKSKGYSKAVKLSSTCSTTAKATFSLALTSLSTDLIDTSFKYAFVNGAGTTISEGNFGSSKQGDVINLTPTAQDLAANSSGTYTLYLWIDGTEHDGVTPNKMQKQPYSFNLTASVTDNIA